MKAAPRLELAGNQNWDEKRERERERERERWYRRARPGRVLFGLTGAGT